MKHIMAVYDVDPFYADRFAEVVNQKEKVPFTVMAFTSMEKLMEYAKRNPVDLLLISNSVLSDEAEAVGAGQVIILSDGEGRLPRKKYPSIYKYQSSDDIIREVMACYCEDSEGGGEAIASSRKTVIGVFSPINRCAKTSFAITMGQQMAQEQRVLYINLEEYSGLKYLMGQEYQGDLSDLIYYYWQGSCNSLRLASIVHSIGGLDYIPPAKYPEDFGQMGTEDMAGMISQLIEGSSYEVIIIDAGQYGRQVLPILELCSVVYMPVKDDVISQAKLASFEEYLEESGHEEIKERIRKLKIPVFTDTRKKENYMEQLVWSELGDFVRQIIGGAVRMPV